VVKFYDSLEYCPVVSLEIVIPWLPGKLLVKRVHNSRTISYTFFGPRRYDKILVLMVPDPFRWIGRRGTLRRSNDT